MPSSPRSLAKSPKNVLITGPPGIGKTTLIMELVRSLLPYGPVGFCTREIREEGVRKGFELVSLDGKTGVLAHVGIGGPHRVGKYGVDISGFERFLDGINFLGSEHMVIVIDEIGKMECLSPVFVDMLGRLLDASKPVVATIALKGGATIAAVKQRSDVLLFAMNRSNRGRIQEDVLKCLTPLLPVPPEKKSLGSD